MTYTYCDYPVRDKTSIFINVTIVLGVISGVSILLRLGTKYFLSQADFGLDDLFICLTLLIGMPSTAMNIHGTAGHGEGRDIWTLEFDQITTFGFYFWLLEVFYFAQVSFLKTSLLFFYLRIFPGHAQKLLWGTIIFNTVYGVVFVFLAAFQCTPVNYFWLSWDGEHEGKWYVLFLNSSDPANSLASTSHPSVGRMQQSVSSLTFGCWASQCGIFVSSSYTGRRRLVLPPCLSSEPCESRALPPIKSLANLSVSPS